MDKKELMENLGKVSAGDRNQDPAIKATENNTEKRKMMRQMSMNPVSWKSLEKLKPVLSMKIQR